MTPTNIHNIYTYKKAKQVIKDLELMLKIVNIAIFGISNYIKYKVGAQLLRQLLETKKTLELHIKTCNKIIESKGSIDV